jgi:hypothetical protein
MRVSGSFASERADLALGDLVRTTGTIARRATVAVYRPWEQTS